MSVNADKALYHCFYAGCGFYGGLGTLRNRLGIRREWIPRDEWIRQLRERERMQGAALKLYEAAKVRRVALCDQLRSLNRAEALAHCSGPTEASWDALALVYHGRPVIEADLERLETGSANDVLRHLQVTKDEPMRGENRITHSELVRC